MRLQNSIKNILISTIMSIVTISIGLITQKIFINILGTEYLGINGLFNNIISMLAIAELGIGSAITYSLYKPIADKDEDKIKSLIKFYKINYRIIVCIISFIGICIIPFLNTIVGDNNIKENIIIIYILFLLDTVASYLLTYKRSILYANQKTYIVNIVHILYLILMNLAQVNILVLTKNYFLYLIIKIIFRLIENIIITIISNRMYPFIKDKNVDNIDIDTQKNILLKIKGLVFHKIGGFIVSGTDNIIISSFLGITIVGLYSNYNMIFQAINNLFSQIFSSITAGVGNLIVEKDKTKMYIVYQNMLFINSWMFCFCSIAILCLIEDFISIWIGEKYLLNYITLIILCINFYIQGMRKTTNTFKEAAGIFYEDRFVPLIESIINIFASIIFLNLFGLAGVFLGTITSSMILFLYSYPILVYKKLFNKKYSQFLVVHIKYLIITLICAIITISISKNIIISNLYMKLLVNSILVISVPNLIYILLFRKTNEFKYLKNIVYNFLKIQKNVSNKKNIY